MITFAPDEFTKMVTVPIVDDNIVEIAQENFFGRLTTTDPLVQVTRDQAVILITDIVDSK